VKNNPVIGNGKYIFKEWNHGQDITLERNDNYWDKDWKGYYKTIVCRFTNDPTAREMGIEAGDSKVCLSMPVLMATSYGQSDTVDVVAYDYGQVAHLWYNMTEGRPTADIRVRQAIDKALSFDDLAVVGTGGTAGPSLGYLTPSSPYYNELYTAEERAVDIEGAKTLLEEAGYGDGLDLAIVGLADMMTEYTVIQENLRAVGINLSVETPDTPAFVQAAFNGEYDIIIVGEYIPNRNPSIYTFVNQANIDGGHIIGGPKVTTPELDTLVHESIEEEDNAAAIEKMNKIESIMKDECMQSNLFPQMNAAVIAKDLKGFDLIERGYVDLTSFYE